MGVTYTTSYTYDAGDNIITATLPSGRTVQYGRDGVRRISNIQSDLNGTTTTLIDNIIYRADNAITNRRFGNGLNDQRTYDLQGRLLTQNLDVGDNRIYNYDANSNIIDIQATTQNSILQYDNLDRLTNESSSGSPDKLTTFDLYGNRLQHTQTGINDEQYTYLNGTNRLSTRMQTNAGVLTPNRIFSYNNVGRLFQVFENGTLLATYTYGANGLRTRKVTASGTIVYHYDLDGKLITETQDDGTLIRDYIWQDNSPVAQIDRIGSTDNIHYLHTDHLLTPRLATNNTGTVVWQWNGDAYGETLASEDIDGDGSIVTINLRFPGQYFDQETKFHYNWNRYYDPRIGRYITTDPIGVILELPGKRPNINHLYVYSENNPINDTDPSGLMGLKRALNRFANSELARNIGRAITETAAQNNLMNQEREKRKNELNDLNIQQGRLQSSIEFAKSMERECNKGCIDSLKSGDDPCFSLAQCVENCSEFDAIQTLRDIMNRNDKKAARLRMLSL